METSHSPLKIAVVGGGVAGVTAAFMLDKVHHVTLIEKNSYVGGHTNTIDVKNGKEILPIDTGFIVCNRRNYPIFYRLLEKLGVATRNTEMSFGYACEKSSLGYVGPGVSEFLRRPTSLLNLKFIQLALEQQGFNRRIVRELRSNSLPNIPLRDYVNAHEYTNNFVDNYLIPISAAIWSTPERNILDMPTRTFAAFFNNHGMLELTKRPQWQTIVGGSKAYINAFRERFRGELLTDNPVQSITRTSQHANLRMQDGSEKAFDKVVVACHADEALALLRDPSKEENVLLGAWKYYNNEAVLHSDASVLPRDRRLWASWNYYRREKPSPSPLLAVTYYMNRLQGLNSETDYFVTLNTSTPIQEEKIHCRINYTHPAYNESSIVTQKKIQGLSGAQHTYFCGSYMGYGFHEDAVRSAHDVAFRLGGLL